MSASTSYRPEIDGLRALAVLAILLHHAGVSWLPGGYLGVDVFFVISGFVITRLAVVELAEGRFSPRQFWRRRVRRIVPALAALLAVALPAAWGLMSPDQFDTFVRSFLGAAFLVPNIVQWTQNGYFEAAASTQPLLHLWSLGVEEQFYLLFPLLVPVLWRGGERRLRRGLWTLVVISLVVAATLVVTAPAAGFYLLPSRIWELAIGALAALAHWRPGARAAQLWAGAGLVLILVPMALYGPKSPGPATLPPILGAALCLLAAGPQTWVGRGLALGPVVWLGKVSYGTYLWHWPLLAFTRIHLADEPSLAVKLGLMLVAVALGAASWRWIEAPIRRSADPVLPRAGVGTAAATLAALAAAMGLAWGLDAQGLRKLTWPGMTPEALEADFADYQHLRRAGECHMTDETFEPTPFLAAWDCPATDYEGSKGWPVALYGDSHAAAFSMVLRLAGRNPMQMSAWACSVVPSRMRPDCRALAEKLRDAARADGIRTVMLVNQWQPSEITPETQVEMELWWGEAFDRIILVTPLPHVPKLQERWLRWPVDRVAAEQPDFSTVEAFARARTRIAGSEVVLIDAAALFCGDRPGCSVHDDAPLMRDESPHLTVAGAMQMARRLQDSGLLDRLLP